MNPWKRHPDETVAEDVRAMLRALVTVDPIRRDQIAAWTCRSQEGSRLRTALLEMVDAAARQVHQIGVDLAPAARAATAASGSLLATAALWRGWAQDTTPSPAVTPPRPASDPAESGHEDESLQSLLAGLQKSLHAVRRAQAALAAMSTQEAAIEESVAAARDVGEEVGVLAIQASLEAERHASETQVTPVTGEGQNLIAATLETLAIKAEGLSGQIGEALRDRAASLEEITHTLREGTEAIVQVSSALADRITQMAQEQARRQERHAQWATWADHVESVLQDAAALTARQRARHAEAQDLAAALEKVLAAVQTVTGTLAPWSKNAP